MSCRRWVGIIVSAAVIFSVPSPVAAGNFLQNYDFEAAGLDPWVSSGGGAIVTPSTELIHEGEKSIKISHDKTGSYGCQQTIQNLEGGMFYEVTGYGASKDENVDSYFIRVAWYESGDGSGSQLSSPNDTEKSNLYKGEWILFRQTMQAPAKAKSAKIRLVFASKTNGVLASVYFDDVQFQEAVAPTMTPTTTPSPTPTSTPTSNPTNTPSLTITSAPSSTATIKPTYTRSPLPTKQNVSDILGIQRSVTESATATDSTGSQDEETEVPPEHGRHWLVFSLLFVGTGIGLLSAALALKKTDIWKTHIDQQKDHG